MTAAELLSRIQTQYGNASDAPNIIDQGIRRANEGTIENLLNDYENQKANAYGAFNNAFAAMPTDARGMSPAARLAAAQGSAQQGLANLNLNRGIRDYYNSSINDTIQKALNAWQTGYSTLKDQYAMQYQKEQDDWQRKMAERAYAASQVKPYQWTDDYSQGQARAIKDTAGNAGRQWIGAAKNTLSKPINIMAGVQNLSRSINPSSFNAGNAISAGKNLLGYLFK